MRTKNADHIEAIEKFISSYVDEYGSSPSVQEIADGVGVSKPTASRYVSYMRDNGILECNGNHRSIITSKDKQTRQQTLRVPVLGMVSCGIPKLAEENIEEYVRLPVSLFGRGDFYLLRANGDSMIEAGIDDGDFVLIRQQNFADEGQIVVALIKDEATLKRFYPDYRNGIIRLHPENHTMKDIIVDSCIIQGVAVRVLKDLE
ncbi:MAG: transcriptional repressor LexA [Eubacteriales bacterium]|nr:transcriptional repressor LexA [Eubacteriales bacterium]